MKLKFRLVIFSIMFNRNRGNIQNIIMFLKRIHSNRRNLEILKKRTGNRSDSPPCTACTSLESLSSKRETTTWSINRWKPFLLFTQAGLCTLSSSVMLCSLLLWVRNWMRKTIKKPASPLHCICILNQDFTKSSILQSFPFFYTFVSHRTCTIDLNI